jgi:4-hydroxy-3-methylbut-2-enyl diphosphate reductase
MRIAESPGPSPLWIAAPLRVEALAVRGAVPGARVVRTGMGPRRAVRAAVRLRGAPAAALAVAGVCGALDDRFAPGDVLVASALHGPDGERIPLAADRLLAALAALGIDAHAAAIAGVPTLAAGWRREELLAGGAGAVDMESFWLADAAAGRPFAVLRVVLDGPVRELWRPDLPLRLVSVLRRLRAAAPALGTWAATVAGPTLSFPLPAGAQPALARGA